MKGWQIGLVLGGAVIVLLFAWGALLETDFGEVPAPQPVPKEQPAPVEPEPVVPTPERLSVEEIYNTVELGMTEEMVRTIAGKPDMVSTSEVEGLGTTKDLTYNDGMLDNISIFLEDGKVRMVMLGTWNDSNDLDTKTKM